LKDNDYFKGDSVARYEPDDNFNPKPKSFVGEDAEEGKQNRNLD